MTLSVDYKGHRVPPINVEGLKYKPFYHMTPEECALFGEVKEETRSSSTVAQGGTFRNDCNILGTCKHVGAVDCSNCVTVTQDRSS